MNRRKLTHNHTLFTQPVILIILLIIISCTASCLPEFGELPEEEEVLPDSVGILQIDFVIRDYQIPSNKIHLVDLSISTDVENAYKGVFIAKANVSDQKRSYQFKLTEGSYYYQAIITCSCGGDTCLNGGFQGGQFGFKYDIDKVMVSAGSTNQYNTLFD